MRTRYLLSWFVMSILFATTAFAQERSENNSRQASRDSTTNKLIQRVGITSQRDEELKAIGVDLHNYVSRHGRGEVINDERCHAGMSDLVFIGKVMSIVDMPGPSADPFHSKVNVLILEVLRGPRQKSDTIQLLRQSGIVTDVPPSKRRPVEAPANAKVTVTQTITTDAMYKIGETSVFFAGNIKGHPYLTQVYKSTLPKAIQKYPKPSYFLMSNDKFEIKDSIVNYYGHDIPIEQFKSGIKQVARIVDKP